MAEEKRNLCAQIPISLHSRVRQEQEASGQTLSEYMTQLITEFFQMKEGNQNMNHNMKTIAFQVPAELFEEFKAYLQRNNFKQKEFFLGCIQSALRKSETQMRRPALNRNRRRRIKRNNSTKTRRRSSGGVCFFR